jgi:hypothetical protein
MNQAIAEKAPTHFKDCAIVPERDYASNKADAEKLWTLSERMLGQKLDS